LHGLDGSAKPSTPDRSLEQPIQAPVEYPPGLQMALLDQGSGPVHFLRIFLDSPRAKE
jgi:hypothetical protein